MTAVDGQWLAELGPMFYSVKDTQKSRTERRAVAMQHMQEMEEEMKRAQDTIRQRKEEAEKDHVSSRSVKWGHDIIVLFF